MGDKVADLVARSKAALSAAPAPVDKVADLVARSKRALAAPVAPPAPPATSPQLQDPIAVALGGGGSVDPRLAPPSMAEGRTPEQLWAERATRQVAGAHDINRDRIEQQYGGLGTKVGTALASAAAAPVRAITDPIAQGFEKGTALGIGGGLARGAFGGLMAATPIGNAFIQAGNASRLAQESERMGLDVPVLGRIGAAPSMPFEAAAHALPDFEKMRQESRRLGMPGAEALSEVGQLANEALPIAVLGGVHRGITNEVGLRRGIVAPPIPEQLPGTQVGRLRGARPAPVAEPVAPAMRPVPPNVTGTTGVRAASPEMAAELRASNVPLETPAIPAPAPVVETVPGRLRTSKPAPIDAPAGPVAEPQLSPGEATRLASAKFRGVVPPSRAGVRINAEKYPASAELQNADAPGATTADGPPVRAFVKGGTLRNAFNESAPQRLQTAARKAGYEDVWAAREALRTDENAATMFRAGIADEIAALPDPQATPVTSTEVTGPRLRPAALTPEEPPRAPAPPPPAPAAPAPPQGVRPPKSAESAGPMDRPRFNPMQQEPRAAEPPLLQTTGENPGVMEPGRAPPARDASDFTSDGGGRRPRALPAPEPVKPAPVAEVAPTPRPIPDADAPNVATMQRRSFNEGVRAEKGKPGVETFPADDYGFTEAVFRDENGVVRGVASYSSATDTHKANINVAVDPAFQRKGIASSLYRALEESGVPVSDVSGTMGMTESGAAFVKGRKRVAPAVEAKPASPELPPPAEVSPVAQRMSAHVASSLKAQGIDVATSVTRSGSGTNVTYEFSRGGQVLGKAMRRVGDDGAISLSTISLRGGTRILRPLYEAESEFARAGGHPVRSRLTSDITRAKFHEHYTGAQEINGGKTLEWKPAEPAVQAKPETAREPWQMRAEEYQRDNPHGWRKGATPYQRADAFDALQGDPDVWVFHATTDAAADAMLSGGVRMADKPWTLARERFKTGGDATFQPGSGLGDGLYVGADPMSVDGYGRRILAIKVKKSSIKVPPEGELLGKRTAGRALADSDAHVVGDIKPSAIVDVTEPKKSGSPGHEQFVKRALREGKPVPPEVLAEYPDLVPPAEPAPAPKVEAPAPASVPEIPETSAPSPANSQATLESSPAPSPQRAFIDRFVQATREGKTEDAAAEYRAMPLTERTKIFDAFVADGLFKRGDGWGLPAIKAHADRVVAAEKATIAKPSRVVGAGVEEATWRKTEPRKGHVYRGMEPAEFESAVGKKRGIETKTSPENQYELGTSFSKSSHASDASKYALYGDGVLKEPRERGYVVEAKRTENHSSGGLLDEGEVVGVGRTPFKDITRVWEIRSTPREDGGRTVTWHEVPKDQWSLAAEKAAAPAPAKPYGVNKGKLRRGGKQSGAVFNPFQFKPPKAPTPESVINESTRSFAPTISERAQKTWEAITKLTPGTGAFRHRFLDKLGNLERYEREMTGTVSDTGPTAFARVAARGASGAAEAYATRGVLLGTDKFHKPLVNTLEPIAHVEPKAGSLRKAKAQFVDMDNVRDFEAFVLARRAQDYIARGLDPGIDPVKAQEILAKRANDPVFQRAAKEFTEWQNRPFELLLKEMGIPDTDIAAIRERNPNFTHVERVFSDEWGKSGDGGKGIAGVGNAVKKITGSKRAIYHPIEAALANTEAVLQALAKVRAQRRLIEVAEQFDTAGEGVKKVPPQGQVLHRELGDFQKQIKDALGVDMTPEQASTIIDIWNAKHVARPNERIVTMWKDGKPQSYELHPDLMRVMAEIGPEGASRATQLAKMLRDSPLGLATRTMKMGATGYRIGFSAIANPIRDFIESLVNSQYWTAYPRGMKESVMRGTRATDVYKASGASSGSFAHAEMGAPGASAKSVLRASSAVGRAKNFIGRGPNALIRASEFTEGIPRKGEFLVDLEAQGWNPRSGVPPTVEQAVRAANKAADVTIDFSRIGEWMQPLNQIVPFLNPAIQGTNKTIRNFHRRPVQTLGRSLATAGMASLALWYLNKDREAYKNKTAWQRKNYWNAEIDGTDIQLPKPPGYVSLIANLVEDTADAMYREGTFPKDLEETIKEYLKNATPPVMPLGMDVYVGVKSNKDDFTGRPIVKRSLEDADVAEQYDEQTTETAKAVAKIIGVSPMKTDWVMNRLTGNMSRDVIGTAERWTGADKDRAAYTKPPVFGRFIASDAASDAFEEFWEIKKELETRRATVNLRKRMPERGDAPYFVPPKILTHISETGKVLTDMRNEAIKETDKSKRAAMMSEFHDAARSARDYVKEWLAESALPTDPGAK